MTIAVGAVTFSEICVLADSRISWSDHAGNVLNARDVAQKLLCPNGWSLIAWAGNLCLARDVLRTLFKKVKETDPFYPDWLRDNNAIRDFLKQAIGLHGKRRARHKKCERETIQFMIAWIDYGINPFSRPMEVITITSPGLKISRTTFGIDVIGSGNIILDSMRYQSFMEVASSFLDEPNGPIKRTFVCAGEVAKYLRQVRVNSVGGLFQIAVLSTEGSRLVDHFQLVPVIDRFGTYVAMRTRSGMWLQEHRPTGSVVKIQAPFDIELQGPTSGQSKVFNPRTMLARDSPGVFEIPVGPVMEFCHYDPDDVPQPVRESWGTEPLERLSYSQGPPPKRWRKR